MGSFEVLDVHHHVGNAFRALGGDVDQKAGLTLEDYRRQGGTATSA